MLRWVASSQKAVEASIVAALLPDICVRYRVIMMNAGVYESFGGPIRVKRVPIPDLPDDKSVLVQVMATGVCRSDWHGWKGHDGDVRTHGLPFVPGHEFSGVVVRKGSQVHNFQIGDRMAIPFILSCGQCHYCCHPIDPQNNQPTICAQQQQPGFTQWGSFAEYVAVPRADRNCHRLPSGVSFVQAAALGCRFTTAYRAVLQQGRLSNATFRVSIAVFGCGGLGLSCIMLAAANRMASMVVAVDISSQALDKARSLGATQTVLVNPQDTPEAIAKRVLKVVSKSRVMEAPPIDGIDLTLDAAGFSATSEAAVHATRPGGRMVQVGLPHPSPSIPMARVAGKEITIVGSHGFDAQKMPDLLQLVSNDPTLDPCRLVERQVTLEDGCLALQDMDRVSPLGMVMITKFGSGNLTGQASSRL